MDDNKNLEGQAQQNQEPDNKPEEKEPTVEELMAQLAQERANNAKLKNSFDKTSSELANTKKQLREKQSAEEQEEEAKKEAEEEHKKYVKGLEDTIRMTTNRYLAIGMSAEMAKDTAKAELENDMEKVTENMSKFKDASIKAAESEWLKSRPPVNAGQGEGEETDLFLKGFNG